MPAGAGVRPDIDHEAYQGHGNPPSDRTARSHGSATTDKATARPTVTTWRGTTDRQRTAKKFRGLSEISSGEDWRQCVAVVDVCADMSRRWNTVSRSHATGRKVTLESPADRLGERRCSLLF